MTDTTLTNIRIDPAKRSERRLLDGLMQFYFYDFSEMEPEESGFMHFDARGGFGPYVYMDAYWREPERHPLLIRAGDKPVGFALLNNHSYLGGTVERNMGEFFVARKYRRRGIAAEAVRQILAAYPGRWEIAVMERNIGAKAFWPRAIAAAPNVSDIAPHEGDGEHWTGPIWSFLAA